MTWVCLVLKKEPEGRSILIGLAVTLVCAEPPPSFALSSINAHGPYPRTPQTWDMQQSPCEFGERLTHLDTRQSPHSPKQEQDNDHETDPLFLRPPFSHAQQDRFPARCCLGCRGHPRHPDSANLHPEVRSVLFCPSLAAQGLTRIFVESCRCSRNQEKLETNPLGDIGQESTNSSVADDDDVEAKGSDSPSSEKLEEGAVRYDASWTDAPGRR